MTNSDDEKIVITRKEFMTAVKKATVMSDEMEMLIQLAKDTPNDYHLGAKIRIELRNIENNIT